MIVLGGLHTESASLKAIGHLLEDSGWSEALSLANVATPDTTDSFLHASHITKTRYCHQVTAAALYILQHHAYEKYTVDQKEMTFEVCCRHKAAVPTFLYWNTVMESELTILTFIHFL